MMWRLIVIGAMLMLSACANIRGVPAGPYRVDNSFAVDLGQQWAELPAVLAPGFTGKLLTIDGPLLNRLQLAGNLAAGKSLVKAPDKEHKVPVYRADMSLSEVTGFVTDSLAAQGLKDVTARGVAPAVIGSEEAVRFQVSARSEEGLEMTGAVLAGKKDGKLNVIIFLAPSEYYYGLRAAEVEHVLSSARYI
jgi:hypothetical protein